VSEPTLGAIEASLRRRFRVVETTIDVGGRKLALLHPASAEELIDERAFEHDERLPYWAELWPSSRVMAGQIAGLAGRGRTLLELGCGAGMVAACAARAGFDVVASDYYDDAVRFARVNAARNSGVTIRGQMLDWRRLPDDLPRFDMVVASDVLYERPYGALIAAVLARTLAKGGVGLIADPGRVGRDDFLAALEPLGLRVSSRTARRFQEDKVRQTITLFEIVRRGSRAGGSF
jgi:ETFB lysine methyltransferase